MAHINLPRSTPEFEYFILEAWRAAHPRKKMHIWYIKWIAPHYGYLIEQNIDTDKEHVRAFMRHEDKRLFVSAFSTYLYPTVQNLIQKYSPIFIATDTPFLNKIAACTKSKKAT